MTYIPKRKKIQKIRRFLKKFNNKNLPSFIKKLKFKREHQELIDHALTTAQKYDAFTSHQEKRLKALLERHYQEDILKRATIHSLSSQILKESYV